MPLIKLLAMTVLLGAGPAQKMIPAGDQPITAGGFCFRIVRIAFDTTATGFVPEDMGPKDVLMFVEFELLSGNRDDFKGLPMVLDRGSGGRSKAVVLFSGGMMKALTAVSIKTAAYGYRPENSNITWAYIVRESEADFCLILPTGTIISLAPLIKKDHSERGSVRGEVDPVPEGLDGGHDPWDEHFASNPLRWYHSSSFHPGYDRSR